MIGDLSDMLARLRAQFPRSWFQTSDALDASLQGPASVLATSYAQIQYAKLQTRILTATDAYLDMIAFDFFGDAIARKANQSDASFRATIIANLLRERATRNAISKTLIDLTGRAPLIIEPQRPADTGAYGAPNSGYNLAGAYGSLSLPYQQFVVAYRPAGSGIPSVGGYGLANYGATSGGPGGYGIASQIEYASLSQIVDNVTDADIYEAIDAVKTAGTTVWTRIDSNPPGPYGQLDTDFVLDTSVLL